MAWFRVHTDSPEMLDEFGGPALRVKRLQRLRACAPLQPLRLAYRGSRNRQLAANVDVGRVDRYTAHIDEEGRNEFVPAVAHVSRSVLAFVCMAHMV